MPDKTAAGDAIFALDHVSFSYTEDRTILHESSFALHTGEKIGLYGTNGSGKTTVFRLITGLVHAQSGRILLHGQHVQDEAMWWTLRCKIGFVLQHADDQLFCPTVLEDVAFGPLNLGMQPDAARARALQTLESLGLSGFEERLTHRLSGGEKKLVALAAVLSMQPEALLLDEPTNDLDPHARARLLDILHKQNTARIIISHDWDFLAATSEKYFLLADGHLQETNVSLAHGHFHAHPFGNQPHEHESCLPFPA